MQRRVMRSCWYTRLRERKPRARTLSARVHRALGILRCLVPRTPDPRRTTDFQPRERTPAQRGDACPAYERPPCERTPAPHVNFRPACERPFRGRTLALGRVVGRVVVSAPPEVAAERSEVEVAAERAAVKVPTEGAPGEVSEAPEVAVERSAVDVAAERAVFEVTADRAAVEGAKPLRLRDQVASARRKAGRCESCARA